MNKVILHSRVALKDGADQVYVYALAGTEGWVRAEKQDSEGFQLFRIEWDKEHWRYNGQPDGWTFAEHFKVIGPPDPDAMEAEPPDEEDDEVDEDVEMQDDVEEEEPENDLESYMESLSAAFDSAAEAEGFMVFTVRRIPNPDNPDEVAYVPTLFQHATTKQAALLLDVQLADAASTNYQEMIFNLMAVMKPNEIDE